MDVISYRNFDLLIQRTAAGYRAQVVDSPAGQGSVSFTLPFSDLELENLLLRISQRKRGMRRVGGTEMGAVREFGGRLFESVFAGEVRDCLRGSLDETDHPGSGLRIRLRLSDVPELADLPWEYLYRASRNRFLTLSVETPLVRYPHLQERIDRLAVKFPLKVLVMISSPTDHPQLDLDQEWTNLRKALGDLEQRGLVTVDRLDDATLEMLGKRLDRTAYNIFHFIGHGGFDANDQDGVLIFEDEHHRGVRASGRKLGMLLYDHRRSLRLAVLNACEGARVGRTDPFSGTAQSLVQQGIPAVIAMQFEISDEAAITLTQAFYTALAEGQPVDTALANARKVIFARGNEVEWGTPVLYLRSPDGQIFDVQQQAGASAEIQPKLAVEPAPVQPSDPARPKADEGTLLDSENQPEPRPDVTRPAPEPRPLLGSTPMRKLSRGPLSAAAAVLLLLAGTGVWYWDAYYRPHIEYYTTVIKRGGLPEGVGRLTDEQARLRNTTLEFIRKGRREPVLELRVVNSRGDYPPISAQSGLFLLRGLNPLQNETQAGGLSLPGNMVTRRVVFERHADGRILTQRAYNAAGRLLYALQYAEPNLAKFGAGVFAEAVRESGITHIRFVRPDTGPEAGLDKEILYLDSAGKPQPDRDGTYGRRYVFNSLGLPVEEINLKADGQPAVDKNGIAKVANTYDALGNITRQVSLGRQGQPVLGSTGAAERTMSYDQNGNLAEMAFFDKEGRLVTQKDLGAAVRTFAHDGRGNIIENTFRDVNRRLVIGPWGFAKQKIEWDEKGRSLESLFGADDKPILIKGRVMKLRGVWDKYGYPAEIAYFDETSSLVRADDGCAKERFKYDDHGNLVELGCFNEGDRPVRTTDGWATVRMVHDDRGNVTQKSFFGPKDQPELYEEPFVKVVSTYTAQGKESKLEYFDAASRAVKRKAGYAKVTYNYNTEGKLIEVSFFDEQGQPTARKGGYARIVRAYDARGNMVEETTFDLQGKPVRHEDDGYSRAKSVYDDRGYRIEQTYFDENDRPILHKDGYTKVLWKYNDKGKKVEEALFGLDGAPVASKQSGSAKKRWTYYERGNVSQIAFFGPNDQPVRTTVGWATVRYSYDGLGRESKQEFFDVDGAPVFTRVAIKKVEPDSKAQRVELRVGDLILNYDGEEVIDTRVFDELELVKGERPRELRIQRDGKILSLDVDVGRLTGLELVAKVSAGIKRADR